MRVTIVGPDASAKGGIATVIHNFKGITADSLLDLFFFTTWKEGSKSQHLRDTLVSVITFPFFLKKNKIELVHLHVAQNGSFYRKALLLLIAKLLGVPTIFQLHASQFDKFYESKPKRLQKLISFLLEQGTGVVVLSESWKVFYESIAKIDCQVIENAVSVPEKNQYDSQSKKIVSFGRLGQRKGTFDLVKVAKKIGQHYPENQFVLYGDGEIEEVTALIEQLGVTNVTLGGWVTAHKKSQILRETQIHVLPSYQEGMPMAILETMAQGIPNISTKVGGIPQVIESGKSGLLIDPGNLKQLEKAIISLIEDETLAKEISQMSYQTIKTTFSLEVYYQKWLDYYQRIEGESINGRNH